MQTLSLEIDFSELTLEWEHEPGQKETLTQEGLPESTELISCVFRGAEIIDTLIDEEKEAIEKWYFKEHDPY